MDKDLVKFYDYIKVLKENNTYCKYDDKKGNLVLVPTIKMLCNCEYLEMTKAQYEKAMYNQIIDNTIKLETKKGTTLMDKSQLTHKKTDAGILVDVETQLYRAWVVSNGIGVRHTFNNKKQALEFLEKINEKFKFILEKGE